MVQFCVLVTVNFKIYSNHHMWNSSFKIKPSTSIKSYERPHLYNPYLKVNKQSCQVSLLNFLNEITHLSFFLELSIIIFWGYQDGNLILMFTIEPGQITRMYRLDWLYTGSKG